jgi:hypothetical protein
MRCRSCGRKMRLVRVLPDNTKLVAGFEHHVFHCPDGHDHGGKLVFSRTIGSLPPEPIGLPSASRRSSKLTGGAAAVAISRTWAQIVGTVPHWAPLKACAKIAAMFRHSNDPGRVENASTAYSALAPLAPILQAAAGGESSALKTMTAVHIDEAILLLRRLSRMHRRPPSSRSQQASLAFRELAKTAAM